MGSKASSVDQKEGVKRKWEQKQGVTRKSLGGGTAKSVKLIVTSNGDKVVCKQYPRARIKTFWREVEILQHLHDCPFVPKLQSVDAAHLQFTMSYCGEKLKRKDPATLQEISDKLMLLEQKWGVVRKENQGRKPPQLYNGPNFGNYTRSGDQLFVIDFGSPRWLLLPAAGDTRVQTR